MWIYGSKCETKQIQQQPEKKINGLNARKISLYIQPYKLNQDKNKFIQQLQQCTF